MSSHEELSNEHDRPTKRRIQRRHGACEPCRSSKTKCDGRIPCGACRSERRRQCPCVYSVKAMKLQQVTAEIRRQAESEKRSSDEARRSLSEDEARGPTLDDDHDSTAEISPFEDGNEANMTRPVRTQEISEVDIDIARMIHPLSVCATVEEFKRLKPARGYSSQVVARCNGFDILENSTTSQPISDATQPYGLAPSLQQSVHALDLSQDSVDVRILGARFDAVDDQIKRGHVDRAWADLASIVREAQLLQDANTEHQSSSSSRNWQHLWTKILDLEAQLGITIGRPICMMLGQQKRTKEKSDTISLEESFEETKTDLYQHIQGMLSLDLQNPTAIRDFLERARNALRHEPFTQIGLCTTKEHSAAVRDLHLSTHLFFMVIFCRMASLCDLFSRDLTNGSWSETPAADIIRSENLHQPRQKLAYCRKMFRSAKFILESFLSLHSSDAEQTGRNWIRCHSAYTAAVILGIAKLRHEVEWHATTESLRRLELIFSKMSQKHPRCQLFSAAVERLRDLNSVKEPASEAARLKHARRKRDRLSAAPSIQASPREADHPSLQAGLDTTPTSASPKVAAKRTIDMVDQHAGANPLPREQYMQDHSQEQEYRQPPAAIPPYEDYSLDHLSLFQDHSANYSQSNASFTNTSSASSATSFSEADAPTHAIADVSDDHPGPPFAYPFPYSVFHPPMTWNNTMYAMSNQPNTPLAIQIPLISQYVPDSSPMACNIGPTLNMTNDHNVVASDNRSHQPSPLNAPSDGTLVPPEMSPSMPSDSGMHKPTPTGERTPIHKLNGHPVSQHTKPVLQGGVTSNNAQRPVIGRGNSANAVQQASSSAHKNLQPSVMEWHATPNIAVMHDMQQPRATEHLRVANDGQGPAPDTVGRTNLQPHQQELGHCFPQQAISHMPVIAGTGLFPSGQISYLNPATGNLEPQHIQGHYLPSHLQPYTRYVVSDSGQLQEQWPRMSVGAGPSGGDLF